MIQKPYNPLQWKHLIPDIERVIADMDETPIVAVGVTPFTRIAPSFFLKNFSIYTIKHSSDVDVMQTAMRMEVLEDRHPKVAEKVHSTGYLINNYAFQNFLKSRRVQPKLMFYTMTEKIMEALDSMGIGWIGNAPHTFASVMFKGSFRDIVRERGLPALDSHTFPRSNFLMLAYEQLTELCEGSFVVQRADKETGGNEGTFFVHAPDDYVHCIEVLQEDETFNEVVVTPFIEGQSTSMLGCVLQQGVLSGPLQLQLIDVPEALHGVHPNGIFFGNDIGFSQWDSDIELAAQRVIESIGEYLREQGYRGVFGIDFLYDKKRNKIFPNECNPRFTGSLVLYSLTLLERHVPPLEFFHLLAHLDVPATFDFDAMNAALKERLPYTHIAISPKGITHMGLPFLAGVYEYDAAVPEISYKGPGMTLADLKNEKQFMLIDTVPSLGASIEQEVPRLFKFIFPRSIARSSYAIDEEAGFLLERFSKTLLAAVHDA